MWNRQKLGECGCPKKALYPISKSATSNCMISMPKISRVPKIMGRAILLTRVTLHQGLCHRKEPDWGVAKTRITPYGRKSSGTEVRRAASIDEDSVELAIFDNGADYEWILPWLWNKVRVDNAVEGDGDLGPLKVLRGGG
jgi:hypothetical protein